MKIKEIIVVEGKDDTVAIQRAVCADTIETNGSALNQSTIEQIKRASKVRGVIIFTDPDYPGEKIRKEITKQVPNCKHAFLPRHLAKHQYKKGVGVEYASPEAIREALRNARIEVETTRESISREELLEHGLIGHPKAKSRREKLGELLNIGYANGKQLHKRLNMFRITREEFAAAMKRVIQEESRDE